MIKKILNFINKSGDIILSKVDQTKKFRGIGEAIICLSLVLLIWSMHGKESAREIGESIRIGTIPVLSYTVLFIYPMIRLLIAMFYDSRNGSSLRVLLKSISSFAILFFIPFVVFGFVYDELWNGQDSIKESLIITLIYCIVSTSCYFIHRKFFSKYTYLFLYLIAILWILFATLPSFIIGLIILNDYI